MKIIAERNQTETKQKRNNRFPTQTNKQQTHTHPTPPTSPGGGHPLMDGHPHRCSTDFEQTLPGGHLTRRGLVSTSPSGYVTAFGEAGVPTPGLEGGVGCNPRVTLDGKV